MADLATTDDKSLPGPAWLSTALKIGIPSFISLIFVWSLVGPDGVLKELVTRMTVLEAQHAEMKHDAERNATRDERNYGLTLEILRTLKVSCVNAAKTADARERCLSGGISLP